MIAIGRDHGGVELEDYLVGVPRAMGVAVRDCGTHGKASVDYPDFGREVSFRVASGEAERGVLEGATGLPVGRHKISRVERDLGTQINGQEKN